MTLARTLLLLGALGGAPAAAAAAQSAADTGAARPTIAVLYFSNGAFVKHADYEPLSKGIAEMLIAELAASPHLQVVERERLQQLLDEQDLGAAGRLDPATAARLGRVLGARYMLTGGFVIDGKERMRLDLRAVNVETSAIEYVESVRGKSEDALDLIAELGGKVVARLRLPPTPRTERPSSSAERRPDRAARLRALMLMSRGLYEKDRGELETAADYFRRALEADPGFERAQVLLASVR
jgi:TolB-like protein